ALEVPGPPGDLEGSVDAQAVYRAVLVVRMGVDRPVVKAERAGLVDDVACPPGCEVNKNGRPEDALTRGQVAAGIGDDRRPDHLARGIRGIYARGIHARDGREVKVGNGKVELPCPRTGQGR